MNLKKGDRILVNIAPFIGSAAPGRQSVPCEVLAIEERKVHVRAEPPYRSVSLWVLSHWIEDQPARTEKLVALHP